MAESSQTAEAVVADDQGLLGGIISEIVNSPLNIALVGIITLLVYKIVKSRQQETQARSTPPEPTLPKLRKDFTVQELKAYDGNQPDGRVLVAVNGTVYDVTKGKRFYGPGKNVYFFAPQLIVASSVFYI